MASKAEKRMEAMIAQMQAQISKMSEPKNNPALDFLTNEALSGAEYLKKGDYSQMPKGMFFDYKNPVEQNQQYKKAINVNQGGTFALADNGGAGNAMGLQKQFLSDKFARDSAQNYQDNISNSAGSIRSALGGVASGKGEQDTRIMSAMQGLTGILGAMPEKKKWWESIIGPAAGIAGSLITKF